MLSLGVIDGVIEEPTGGAHRDRNTVFDSLRKKLVESLEFFDKMTPKGIKEQRRDKFLAIGATGLD